MNLVTHYRALMRRQGPFDVFRYYGDDNSCPEKYVPGAGWIEDSWIWVLEAGGDIDLVDVTEAEALRIARDLDAKKPAIFYYAIQFRDGEPEALLRCYKHDARPAERYVPGSGWIKDDRAWLRDTEDRDVHLKDVTEQQALDITRNLERSATRG